MGGRSGCPESHPQPLAAPPRHRLDGPARRQHKDQHRRSGKGSYLHVIQTMPFLSSVKINPSLTFCSSSFADIQNLAKASRATVVEGHICD